jgi:hypothetical protein
MNWDGGEVLERSMEEIKIIDFVSGFSRFDL